MKISSSSLGNVLGLAAFATMVGACQGAVGDFRDSAHAAVDQVNAENTAYNNLKAVAGNRGESSTGALTAWLTQLRNTSAAMAGANKVILDHQKKETDIRADKESQELLNSLKSGVDQMLSRGYEEASLKLVPSWRLTDAQQLAAEVPADLNTINGYYATVFQTTNPYAGKAFAPLGINLDATLIDTAQPCIDMVSQLAAGQAKSDFCVTAARASCGHQINLSCLNTQVNAKLANNLCPDVVTDTSHTVRAGETFNASSALRAGEELKGEIKYGDVVQVPNPDRVKADFCPDSGYDDQLKGFSASKVCRFASYDQPVVTIYGYDQNRDVTVEISGLRHSEDLSKMITVEIDVDGVNVGNQRFNPDYSRSGFASPVGTVGSAQGGSTVGVYTMKINNRAFRPGTILTLKFLSMFDATRPNPKAQKTSDGGMSAPAEIHFKAPWIVRAQIMGEDIPTISQRQVILTKYVPNTWMTATVNGCVSDEFVTR